MEKFYISYKVYKEKTYVIPVLLKDNSLPFDKSKGIRLKLEYKDYFPKEIFPKFICLVHSLIVKDKKQKEPAVYKTGRYY